jgi:predicted transcriptional regulator
MTDLERRIEKIIHPAKIGSYDCPYCPEKIEAIVALIHEIRREYETVT